MCVPLLKWNLLKTYIWRSSVRSTHLTCSLLWTSLCVCLFSRDKLYHLWGLTCLDSFHCFVAKKLDSFQQTLGRNHQLELLHGYFALCVCAPPVAGEWVTEWPHHYWSCVFIANNAINWENVILSADFYLELHEPTITKTLLESAILHDVCCVWKSFSFQ